LRTGGSRIRSAFPVGPDKRRGGAVRRKREPSPFGAVQFNYPVVVEEVGLPGPMSVQVCVDVLLAAVVLDATAAVLELLVAPVVAVGFVCADANPMDAIPAIAATTVTMIRE